LMSCPPPSKWSIVSSRQETGTTPHAISEAFGPSQVAVTHTFAATRTVTESWTISSGLSLHIGDLGADIGVKLDRSVTTSRTETMTFTVPKGRRMIMQAYIIYESYALRRTAYDGPNCRPHEETASVLTPINYEVVVGDYTG
jgi:hypothetical protein